MKNESLKNYQNEINKSAQCHSPKRIQTIALSQTQDNEIVVQIDFGQWGCISLLTTAQNTKKQIRTTKRKYSNNNKSSKKIETNDTNLVNPSNIHINCWKFEAQKCYA